MLICCWGLAVYSLWWPSLTKALGTKSKKVLCVVVVRRMQSAWLMGINNKYFINFYILDLCLSGSPENFNAFEFASQLNGSWHCNCSNNIHVAVEVRTTSLEKKGIRIRFDNDVNVEITKIPQQSTDKVGNVRLQRSSDCASSIFINRCALRVAG